MRINSAVSTGHRSREWGNGGLRPERRDAEYQPTIQRRPGGGCDGGRLAHLACSYPVTRAIGSTMQCVAPIAMTQCRSLRACSPKCWVPQANHHECGARVGTCRFHYARPRVTHDTDRKDLTEASCEADEPVRKRLFTSRKHTHKKASSPETVMYITDNVL
jgi:hypothetical protein